MSASQNLSQLISFWEQVKREYGPLLEVTTLVMIDETLKILKEILQDTKN